MMTEYELMDLFQKIKTLNDRSNNRYIQSENPTCLTDVQAIVLHYILFESRKRDVFAKDIESYFGIKASSASSVLDYLEAAGFIRREAMTDDRRLKKLVATDQAKRAEDWLMPALHYNVVDTFAGFTEEEMQALKSLMEKMRLNLEHMATGGSPYYERNPENAYKPLVLPALERE